MKFVLLFALALCFVACSSDEKAVNSNNQKPVTPNKNIAIPSQTPAVSNSNKNTAANTANLNAKTINLGENFTLKGGETGKVKDKGLELKVVTVGTTAPVLNRETGQTGNATPYCRVEATLNGKTDGRQLSTQPGKTDLDFEGFKIQVKNITPTGNIDCSLVVTKINK